MKKASSKLTSQSLMLLPPGSCCTGWLRLACFPLLQMVPISESWGDRS